MVEIEVEIGFNKKFSEEEKEEIAEKVKKVLEIIGMKIDSMEWKNE